MRILILFGLCMSVLAFTAMAQEKSISGKITSTDDGSGLPGVNVVLKGTNIGTVSDIYGEFKLNVPNEGGILVFSFIGYASQEITIGNQSIIDVSLNPEITELSEVVVVGYGTSIKQDLTGNIANVTGEEIEMQPITTVEQALQGRTAGVLITSHNGKLGQAMDVRVRGGSSISATNEPLYVIDGVPMTTASQSSNNALTNPLADLNFNDVASIEILKDASASAIYGSRAANGVVLITTKKGKAGKTKFDVNMQYGFSKPSRLREWNNADQYIELLGEAGFNNDQNEDGAFSDKTVDDIGIGSGIEGHPDYSGSWLESMVDFMDWMDSDYVGDAQYSSINPANTDWQQEAFQSAPYLGFDLSANGGTESTRYFISGSYLNQDGILLGNSFERISARLNLDHSINEKLDFGLNYSISRSVNNRLSTDNAFATPLQLVAQSPITPVANENGLIDNNLNPGAIYYPATVENANSDFPVTVYRNFLNAYLAWKIVDNLSFRAEFGFDLLNQDEQRIQNSETQTGSSVGGYGQSRWVQIFNYTTKGYFNWTPVFNDIHDLNVVAGMEFQESSRKTTDAQAQGFPVDELKTLASAAEPIITFSSLSEYAFVSYFARANYKLNNKYLFSLSARMDGSSRFGENNKYGTFPAVSAGWILTEEGFLTGSTTMSFLKLRASYGLIGNAGIPNYESYGTYTAASYNGSSGLVPEQIPNPNLTWESTQQLDIGFDFGFFSDRLTGEIDYYQKKTEDLLLNIPVPGTSGFRTQFQNIGELENKGVELVLNYTLRAGDFRWETGVNLANNQNKIIALAPGQDLIEGSFQNVVKVGEPIGVFWGVDFAGADPDNGDALWYLPNGETTNDYNEANAPENRKRIGNPTPDLIYGWNNTFLFKGFDLNILFQGVSGNQVYLGGDTFMAANQRWEDNQTTDQNQRWRKVGDVTNVPQARYARNNGGQASSRYVSDGAYARLKAVSLGYSLPTSALRSIGFTNVRVYVSAANLVTITDYVGWDPEVNADAWASNINLGNDFYSAPQPRTVTFGIRAGF